MSLETTYFKREYAYNIKLVERLVYIAQRTGSRLRARRIKHLIFKMMHNIVSKNSLNYLKLVKTLPVNKDEVPSCDELVADCYIVYNRCIEKYRGNSGFNFYFYFNKALSRNFFRLFTRMKDKVDIENCNIDDDITNNLLSISVPGSLGDTHLLMELLNFTAIERRICESRLSGQKNVDFLKQNPDITNSTYNSVLRNIKNKLTNYQKQGEI